MSVYNYFQAFSVFVVVIQLVFGVFRWLYENVVGPNFLEPKNLRRYGNWACKFIEYNFLFRSETLRIFFLCSGNRCYRRYWQGVCKIGMGLIVKLKRVNNYTINISVGKAWIEYYSCVTNTQQIGRCCERN